MKPVSASVGGTMLGAFLGALLVFAFPLGKTPDTPILPMVAEVPKTVRILFAGDIMYDRNIRAHADQYGDAYIFSCIGEELQQYDSVVANLEGPITSRPSVSVGSVVGDPDNTRFTMPLRLAPLLVANNIRAVSLGNNHANDFGEAGIEETKRALAAVGVQYFGEPGKPSVRMHEAPAVLVAFNEFGGSAEETIAAIRAHEGETVIVFSHWGDEYVKATERQKAWARQFIDAGADLVLGAHPHVVQESETYRDVPIYYSLGNFIFDQYFEDAVMRGLALEVSISEQGIGEIVERPLQLSRDRRTCFVSE